MSGRWPSNFVLTHSFGCRRIGVKRVKSTANTPRSRDKISNPYHLTADNFDNNAPTAPNGYANSDGLETIDNFQCVEGCPARRLDGQTRGQRCHKPNTGDDYIPRKGSGMFWEGTEDPGHYRVTDSGPVGGPSRFFFQADWEYERIEAEELWGRSGKSQP